MKKVMVVGEESEARVQVVSTLANEPYTVEAVNSGEEAWNKLSIAPDSYKLVVSYFVLPGISGIELVARIRETPLLDGIPAILLESAGHKIHDGDLMFAYKAGANICLTAPMYPEELIAFSRRFTKDNDMPPRCFECNKVLSEVPSDRENLVAQLRSLTREVAVCLPNNGWFLFCCQDCAKRYEWKNNLHFPRDIKDQVVDIMLLPGRNAE